MRIRAGIRSPDDAFPRTKAKATHSRVGTGVTGGDGGPRNMIPACHGIICYFGQRIILYPCADADYIPYSVVRTPHLETPFVDLAVEENIDYIR